jgi:DNA-binding NarL/FixJ family response regulator
MSNQVFPPVAAIRTLLGLRKDGLSFAGWRLGRLGSLQPFCMAESVSDFRLIKKGICAQSRTSRFQTMNLCHTAIATTCPPTPASHEAGSGVRVALVSSCPDFTNYLDGAMAWGDSLLVVGEWASDGMIDTIHAFLPHVVLLDLDGMPKGAVLTVIGGILRIKSNSKIIAVTDSSENAEILRAFRAGASGHLLKTASRDELRRAICVVLAGGAPMSVWIARRLADALRLPVRMSTAKDGLSARQSEILNLLCEGLSDKEIANCLSITRETVRGHFKTIFEKFRVRTRTAAAIKYSEFLRDEASNR